MKPIGIPFYDKHYPAVSQYAAQLVCTANTAYGLIFADCLSLCFQFLFKFYFYREHYKPHVRQCPETV